MSDVIGLARSLIPEPVAALLGDGTWRDSLLPASFRGATFFVLDHDYTSGRRVVTHEFPLRDRAETEDLGRMARVFRISGYVVGDTYWSDRDALIRALEDAADPGRLVHPYLGEWVARCQNFVLREMQRDGNLASFDMVFVEASEQDDSAPGPRVSTVSQVLSQVRRVMGLARSAFALVYGVGNLGDFARGAATSWLFGLGETLAGKWLGLPGLDLAAVTAAIGGVGGSDPDDPAATAAAVTEPYVALAAVAPAGDVTTAVRGADALGEGAFTSRAEDAFAPGWCGALLLELRGYAGVVVAPVTSGDLVGAGTERNRAALDGLARDAAVIAAAEAFARTEWPSRDAAAAARDAIADAITARMDAAADAGADALHAGWRALMAAVSEDFAARGASFPRLEPYALAGSLPSLALAHRLHQDARRADDLAALNGVPHPAFMPPAGFAVAG